MKVMLGCALALLATWGLVGCTPSAEYYNQAIARQRACDSGTVGWMWRWECSGGNQPMPASCESEGTEGRPECQQWAHENRQPPTWGPAQWIAVGL